MPKFQKGHKPVLPVYDNPWNLAPQQERAVHTHSMTGSYIETAKRLGITRQTVNEALSCARDKMGVNSSLVACVKYALWRQEQLRVKS